MTFRKPLLGIVALLVAGLLVVSTIGFSSATADRNVDVAIVADDEAYLGVQRACSNSTLQVSITNRFSSATTLDIEITVNETVKRIDGLQTGIQETKQFEAFGTGDTITVDASGSGNSVRLTRPLPTGC